MGRRVWIEHAPRQQEVRGPQVATQRTNGTLLGFIVSGPVLHQKGLRIRSRDFQSRPVAIPPQRNRVSEQSHFRSTRQHGASCGREFDRSRWTANLTTRSRFGLPPSPAVAAEDHHVDDHPATSLAVVSGSFTSPAVAAVPSTSPAVAAVSMPWAECMFKGSKDGPVHERLLQHRTFQQYTLFS